MCDSRFSALQMDGDCNMAVLAKQLSFVNGYAFEQTGGKNVYPLLDLITLKDLILEYYACIH